MRLQHCPILHRHLTKPLSCSALIAAVVTTVGANYAETAQSQQHHQYGASQLCAMLQMSITNREGDHNPDGSTLAAVCILLCHATRSRKLDQSRLLTTLLVTNISYVDKIGLFQQGTHVQKLFRDLTTLGNKMGPYDFITQIKHRNDHNVQHQWLTWLKEEACGRLAWAHLVRPILFLAIPWT